MLERFNGANTVPGSDRRWSIAVRSEDADIPYPLTGYTVNFGLARTDDGDVRIRNWRNLPSANGITASGVHPYIYIYIYIHIYIYIYMGVHLTR